MSLDRVIAEYETEAARWRDATRYSAKVAMPYWGEVEGRAVDPLTRKMDALAVLAPSIAASLADAVADIRERLAIAETNTEDQRRIADLNLDVARFAADLVAAARAERTAEESEVARLSDAIHVTLDHVGRWTKADIASALWDTLVGPEVEP